MKAPKTKPIWLETEAPTFPRLKDPIEKEVLIVGGGVTGLTAAYLAAKAGKKVCLVERDRLIRGDSGHTTAHLTGLTDARLHELVKNFGEAGASLAWFAGFFAIEEIARIVEEEAIACKFRRVDGYLCESLIGKGDGPKELAQERDLANRLGFECDLVEAAPIVGKSAMRFRDQALVDPALYLLGLAKAIEAAGGVIFEHSEVTTIEGDPPIATVNGQPIRCEKVLIATQAPLLGKASVATAAYLQSKLTAYSTYVVSGKLPPASVPEVSIWDTSDPYFYLRTERFTDHDRAILGGNDHKTGQADSTIEVYQRLDETFKSILPGVSIDHHWSGQVLEPVDGVPFIGEIEKGQFIATGYDGNGFTFGTIAALMFRDYVLGESNPWQELFSINRSILRPGIWEYFKSNLDYPYYMAADRLKWRPKQENEELPRGAGKIMVIDGEQVACAKDRKGHLHQVSAICTHMGCIVHWNDGEQTWDCPCHGSRFRPSGEVIAGPAETPLAAHAAALSGAK